MESSGTDSKRFIHYAGALFLLMASVVLIWQMTGPTWFKNIKAEITSQPYARTITVNGDAKITSTPDIAMISLSVVSQGATVKKVTTDNNAKMNSVLDQMTKLGLDKKDITTSQYNLQPDYTYPEKGPARIVGYILTQEVTLKIHDLTKIDEVLDSATQLGINNIGQLVFDIDDASPLKKEAREKAFAAAKNKAQEMANAAGVKLGRVVTFSESGDVTPPLYPNYAMERTSALMDASNAPSIQPGSKELRMNVSVTYEID